METSQVISTWLPEAIFRLRSRYGLIYIQQPSVEQFGSFFKTTILEIIIVKIIKQLIIVSSTGKDWGKQTKDIAKKHSQQRSEKLSQLVTMRTLKTWNRMFSHQNANSSCYQLFSYIKAKIWKLQKTAKVALLGNRQESYINKKISASKKLK